MRLYFVILLVTFLDLHVQGGPYIQKCVPRDDSYRTVTFQQYDVTNDSFHIYSHSGYRFGYKYYSDYRSCIYIWTNNTDYVIKLEEIDFELISGYSCYGDNLTMFYTTFDEADDLNFEDKFCGKKGPGTKYSTGNYMFLYFYTSDRSTGRGFEFVISSIHKNDVPTGLSTGAIVGIVFGVLAFIAITIAVVIIVILIWRRKKKSASQQAEEQSHSPANRNEVVTLSTSTTAATVSNENGETVDEPPPYDSCISIPPKSKPSSKDGIFV